MNRAFVVVLEVAAAFVALLFALAVLDVPLVDTYPALHVKRLRFPDIDNVSRDEGFSRYHVNSRGLLGVEPAAPATANVVRIAVFGDSFVESIQVPPEDKFTELLARRLSKSSGGNVVEVWNFGFAGDNVGNAFARWQYQAKPIRFDMVLFSVNDGDLLENRPEDPGASWGAFLVKGSDGRYVLDESHIPLPYGPLGYQARSTLSRLFYSLYQVNSRTRDFVSRKRDEWKIRLARLAPKGNLDDSTNAPSPIQTGEGLGESVIAETRDQLLYVDDEISNVGPAVMILGLPTSRIFHLPGTEFDPARHDGYLRLMEELQQRNVPVIDPYRALSDAVHRGEDPFGDWEPGGHYNKRGHQLIADAIVEALGRATAISMRGERAVQ